MKLIVKFELAILLATTLVFAIDGYLRMPRQVTAFQTAQKIAASVSPARTNGR